jgi:hypothetical protein
MNISSKTDDVCSFSLEVSAGHDMPDLGELPVVSLYNEGLLEPGVSLSLKIRASTDAPVDSRGLIS